MTKKISIALATYNGGQFLSELLISLAGQSHLPYELVISDDNSTDSTIEVIERFILTAPFNVRLIRNSEQLGIIKNFAKAFDGCIGDLIAYCDQDDIWQKEKLERCVSYFDNPNVKLVMHRSEVVNENLEYLGYHIPEKRGTEFGSISFPSTIDMSYGLGHQMLFDAAIYRDYKWVFEQNYTAIEAISQNYDVMFPFLAGLSGDIVALEAPLVKFRRHSTATSDAGLVSSSEATTSGFLQKSENEYLQVSESLLSTASLIEDSILPSMKQHQQQLGAYQRLLKSRARLYALRAEIYGGGFFLSRALALSRLITRSAYRKKHNKGFGRKAFLVDGITALLGLNLTKTLVRLKNKG